MGICELDAIFIRSETHEAAIRRLPAEWAPGRNRVAPPVQAVQTSGLAAFQAAGNRRADVTLRKKQRWEERRFAMGKAQEYREHARRCEILLERVQDLRVRAQLRKERQEWLELAADREAADRRARLEGERGLDEDMTLSSLRAFEQTRDQGPG
jgi:hypothetical protein